ncbi:hypothetical protein [Olleya sp. Hel_I_94]|jgi:hypothetical protein|uniref:hypothetical protein n=1 Tax=Olleya sp. Hel_I_94 TaxID=1250001 RepID=UPI0011A566B3|nr:hypothetical protein [Olleya sp. Hel_I_94]TVZ47504.1 hypothetical protein JM82_2114 [Olleya sp. Hel_I_94]
MKKTIGKPENWQDFESLCKKLWGEVWGIPNKIKKNGRLGQEQAGVDVYGIPKTVTKYWGIQAKGKDDYSVAKLTKKEIITEIEKAKTFKPELEVYIIATTQNKDSKIEEFVRLKDIENRENGSFEILLFCWEDIADLIEENRDTYQWYLHGIGQIGKFDFKISFNELEDELTLRPKFEKRITRYRHTSETASEIIMKRFDAHKSILNSINPIFPFHSNKINKSWCSFDFVMENTGSAVIEDWNISIKFLEGVSKLNDGTPLFPKISLTEYVDNETKTITYRPRDNEPLIQKSNRYFKLSLLPDPNSEKIVFEWELLARDFNRKEVSEIYIEPEYIEKIEIELVNEKSELSEDDVFISYHVVEKEQ